MLKINKDSIFSITLSLILIKDIILRFFNIIFNVYIGQTYYDTAIVYAIIFVFIFTSFYFILKKQKKIGIIFILLFLINIFISPFYNLNKINIIFNWENTFLPYIIEYILYALFSCIIILNIENYNIFLDKFYYASIISIIMTLISLYYSFFKKVGLEINYMVFSYDVLSPSIMLLYYNIIKKRNIISISIFLLISIIILIFGSRGAFLSLAIGSIFIIQMKYKYKIHKILYFFILLIIALILYINIQNILLLIATKLPDNINSRNIYLISNDNLFDLTGRDTIQQILLKNINLFGYGAYGDRLLTTSFYNTYAHNIFLELIIDFGIVFGSIIIIFILLSIISIIKNRNNLIKSLLFIFLPAGFLKLMFSGSYLNIEISFYILIGIILRHFLEKYKVINN